MAQQEGGWPLGLHPLNERIGRFRSFGYSRSLSFNSLINGTSSFSSTSSDFDTESIDSFTRDTRINTLGNLIGITTVINLPRRLSTEQEKPKLKNNLNYKTFFSLCAKPSHSGEVTITQNNNNNNNAPTLGHYLEAERRASSARTENNNIGATNGVAVTYELGALPENELILLSEPNSLFSHGLIVPPRPSDAHEHKGLVFIENVKKSRKQFGSNCDEGMNVTRPNDLLGVEKGFFYALLFPCLACHSHERIMS